MNTYDEDLEVGVTSPLLWPVEPPPPPSYEDSVSIAEQLSKDYAPLTMELTLGRIREEHAHGRHSWMVHEKELDDDVPRRLKNEHFFDVVTTDEVCKISWHPKNVAETKKYVLEKRAFWAKREARDAELLEKWKQFITTEDMELFTRYTSRQMKAHLTWHERKSLGVPEMPLWESTLRIAIGCVCFVPATSALVMLVVVWWHTEYRDFVQTSLTLLVLMVFYLCIGICTPIGIYTHGVERRDAPFLKEKRHAMEALLRQRKDPKAKWN